VTGGTQEAICFDGTPARLLLLRRLLLRLLLLLLLHLVFGHKTSALSGAPCSTDINAPLN
jgi:hypothetical protein